MRIPHRRDISARQDLLGRELRQLFEDFTREEMPEELQQLALQLQSAVEHGSPSSPATVSPRPAPRGNGAIESIDADVSPADPLDSEPVRTVERQA